MLNSFLFFFFNTQVHLRVPVGSEVLGWDWFLHDVKGGTPQVALMIKNLPANAGDLREADLIPGSRISPGGGHGNPLQCSCLENPMDRGAW